jgi:precorrin-6Y C5,15-methyltransferase (decarboxylating)
VVGIGEDGLAGLSPEARRLVEEADVLVGGDRHLAMVPPGKEQRLAWGEGFEAAIERIAGLRGRKVAVLASGDPLDFGAGAALARRFPADEMTVLPVAGAFSLAAARMGWPLAETERITLHGRPLAALNLYLAPGARLLALSRDGATPRQVAEHLTGRGFGASPITVLERMGGPAEARREGTAEAWNHPRAADLNTLAIECRAAPGAAWWPRVPGLPEDAFCHDGQITKREVRAATLAALAPARGRTLWDVGAGSGAVAIEWLRAEPWAAAVAVERDAKRAATIAANAERLGVPSLRVVEGRAPAALAGLSPPPDAVFVGGGLGDAGLLEACWSALAEGGRLVANAVALESQRRLLDWRHSFGGELVRIAVARAEPLGDGTAFRPLFEVVQYAATKKLKADR